MKSLCIYETEEELEMLKNRVEKGETVYTLIGGKTVILGADNTMKLASKREVANLVALFPFAEAEEESEAEIVEKEISEEDKDETNPTGESTDSTRLDSIERRLAAIENHLTSQPVFSKVL